MSTVSFTGLASGIQWQDLIDEIMRLESRPADRLRAQVRSLESKVSAWGTLRNHLERLETAAQELASGDAFRNYEIELNGLPAGAAKPFTITAGTAAEAGSYRINVVQLATAEKLGSTSFASRSDALGLEGSFTLNGVEIELEADQSLAEVAARINAANSGSQRTGVSAAVLTVADGDYRLVLTSEKSGAAGIELTDAEGVLEGLGILSGGQRNQLLAGADAIVEIDGMTITRAENSISDVVAGVTFELTGVTESPIDAIITRNRTAISDAIRALTEGYNEIVDFIEGQSKGMTADAGIGRDSVLRQMRSQLRDALQSQLPDDGQGGLRRLGEIGIEIDRYGRFQVDEKRLEEALAADPAGVEHLFGVREASSGDGGGGGGGVVESKGIAVALVDLTKTFLGTGEGSIRSITDRIGEQVGGVNRRITKLETRLEYRREQLVKQYAALEQALSKSQAQFQWLTTQVNMLGGSW